MASKKCIGCKKIKPLSEFHKQYNTPDGYRYDCKACHILYQERFRRGRGYEREWRKRDWQKYLSMVRAYRRTPGGYYTSLKYRKHAVEFTRQEFVDWDLKQARECYYCGVPEAIMTTLPQFYKKRGTGDFYRLTLDRKDNTQNYTLENIVLACPRCNETKGDFFTAEEFIPIARKYIRPKWEQFSKYSEEKAEVPTGTPPGMEY